MIFNSKKIDNISFGWYAVFKDNSVITELDNLPWIKVPKKKDIVILGLKCRHRHAELIDKAAYAPPRERRSLSFSYSSLDFKKLDNLAESKDLKNYISKAKTKAEADKRLAYYLKKNNIDGRQLINKEPVEKVVSKTILFYDKEGFRGYCVEAATARFKEVFFPYN